MKNVELKTSLRDNPDLSGLARQSIEYSALAYNATDCHVASLLAIRLRRTDGVRDCFVAIAPRNDRNFLVSLEMTSNEKNVV